MNKLISHTLAAIVGMAIGWFAGRIYLQYQMVAALANLASPIAAATAGSALPSMPAQLQQASVAESMLSKIQITGAHLESKAQPMLFTGPNLLAHIKNGTDKSVASLELGYSYRTPGREVPWTEGTGVYFSISGGLAPGEEGDESGFSVNGLAVLKDAMRAHPDGQLTVTVERARKADGSSIE